MANIERRTVKFKPFYRIVTIFVKHPDEKPQYHDPVPREKPLPVHHPARSADRAALLEAPAVRPVLDFFGAGFLAATGARRCVPFFAPALFDGLVSRIVAPLPALAAALERVVPRPDLPPEAFVAVRSVI